MPYRYIKTLTLGVILALVAAISGCSLRKLAYDHAEWLATRTLNSWVDMTTEQEEQTIPKIGLHIAWAKSTLLPDIRSAIAVAANRIENEIGPTEVDQFMERFHIAREEVGLRLASDAAILAKSLTPKQVIFIAKKLNESNEHIEESLAESDERFLSRARKRTQKAVEQFTGPLTSDQVDRLIELNPPSKERYRQWLERRKSGHMKILGLLEERNDPSKIEHTLKLWAKEPWQFRDEPKSEWEARSKKNNAYVLAVIQILDAKNKKHIKRELLAINADLGG